MPNPNTFSHWFGGQLGNFPGKISTLGFGNWVSGQLGADFSSGASTGGTNATAYPVGVTLTMSIGTAVGSAAARAVPSGMAVTPGVGSPTSRGAAAATPSGQALASQAGTATLRAAANALPSGVQCQALYGAGEGGSGGAVVIQGDWATVVRVAEAKCVRRPIATELVTRGYRFPGEARTRSVRVRLTLDAWSPFLDVATLANGVEQTVLLGMRKDRAESYLAGAQPFAVSNINGDHGANERKDYSVRATAGGFYCGGGLQLSRCAQTQEQFSTRVEGPYVQVVVRNWLGHAVVRAVQVANLAGSRGGGTR